MGYLTAARQEVERELERTSASIAGSIARIRKDLSFPTEPLRSAVRDHPVEVILGTVIAGLALGWAVSGKKTKKKASDHANMTTADLAAAEFLHFVRSGRAAGLSEEEAVSRALAANSSLSGRPARQARIKLTSRLTDYVVDMVEAVIKTAIRVAVSEAAVWISDSVRRDRPKASR